MSRIKVNRLIAISRGVRVYDELFHDGVNIIRGENGGGKSTIADLLFYVLGGDVKAWNPEPLRCDDVFAEVEINGEILSIRRPIEESQKRPMYVASGSIESAINAADWSKYPYARSDATRSFSDLIFEKLNYPVHQFTMDSSVTMHQILRLLYVDQATPFENIFRIEPFDKPSLRAAVAEFLLGVDNLAVYEIREKLRLAQKQYSEINGELRALFKALGAEGAKFDIAIIQSQLFEIDRTISELQEEKNSILANPDDADESGGTELQRKGKALEAEIRTVGNQYAIKKSELEKVVADLEDSQYFIEAVEARLDAIKDSIGTAEVLGTTPFQFCPACLSPVLEEAQGSNCSLCKEPIDNDGLSLNRLKMQQELEFQVRESRENLAERRSIREKLEIELNALGKELNRLRNSYRELSQKPSVSSARLDELSEELGYKRREREDLVSKYKMATTIDSTLRSQQSLKAEIGELESKLQQEQRYREARKEAVESKLSELTISLLHDDIGSEAAFTEAEKFEFDFYREWMLLDGRAKFSASSHVILKNSFLFSMFLLSLSDELVRWPRFVLMDNIEDKGMTPERSANFQRNMVERSRLSAVQHQIIFTTSMIAPDLEDSAHCVGPHFDPKKKNWSLKFNA